MLCFSFKVNLECWEGQVWKSVPSCTFDQLIIGTLFYNYFYLCYGSICQSINIATDTPEKDKIREKKKSKSESKTLNAKRKHKNKKERFIKNLDFDSESENVDVDLVLEDEDDVTDLLEIMNQEINEKEEEIKFERESFEEGEYVLVGFSKKNGPPVHYVGKIMSKDEDNFEYQIKFYKRIRNGSKFVKESEEIFDIVAEDIVVKLPTPIKLSGSARTDGQLWVLVDFSSFNVKWFS